jgi:dihydroneopterin aldolase
MLSIYLQNLRFRSYHGLHSEEKLTGGEFEVNLKVCFHPPVLPVTSLHDTVNYVSLYALIKNQMEQPAELLETIATELAGQILAQFSLVEEVEISITKLHPPIVGFKGLVKVSYHKKREQ